MKLQYLKFIILLGLFSAFNFVFAADSGPKACGDTDKLCNPLQADSIEKLLPQLLKIVVKLGSIVLVFYVIYAGFLMVKAQGKPEEIKKAKNALLYALIGGAILIGAQAIATGLQETIKGLN
jgi:hypothetical protein